MLEDDRHYFPPYDAVPDRAAGVVPALSRSARNIRTDWPGAITADDMRKMNYAVDGEKRDAAAVAREFLKERNLL